MSTSTAPARPSHPWAPQGGLDTGVGRPGVHRAEHLGPEGHQGAVAVWGRDEEGSRAGSGLRSGLAGSGPRGMRGLGELTGTSGRKGLAAPGPPHDHTQALQPPDAPVGLGD